jgi:hypothetical protein
MTSQIVIAAICGVVLAPGLGVHAAIGSSADPGLDTPLRNIPKAVVLPPLNPVPTLRIMNVRLEAPPADAPTPSAVLKFDMLNDGGSKVTDIVIQISMLERPRDEHALGSRRFVVNPFMIRGSVTLEAGYTMNYEMLLRNLSADCACVPNVVVISARPVPATS